MVFPLVPEGAPDEAIYMTPSASTDPFTCGLPRDVTLRLLAGPGKFTATDLRLYLGTDHWRDTKAQAERYWGRFCEDCGLAATQTHHTHEGYRHLFREDVVRHLRRVCGTHHRRRHGK